ncbi:MAG: SAM-dependent DNA methyltransferase [Prevotellamassilia timonensis]|nr:SAM-dependent DNA methyltransferase [Prevotellamassilia timonensis]
MEQSQFNTLVSFIWNIATDVLVYAFDKGEYKKIILPMMVIRRIDVLLEPTKDKVVEMKERLDKAGILNNQDQVFYNITGYPFYNTSKFTLKTLKSEIDPQRLKQNFIAYLNGFSQDVLDIIEKLHLHQVVDNLTETGRLGSIIEKFTDDSINLSSKPVLNEDGTVRLPALDNHTMGTMFEELLRRFNEENNVTEAGEHFTPRDYVKLLADLAVLPIADKITDNTYHIYDGACGTGGILTIAQERIEKIAEERGKNVTINIFGQESAPDTYATSKADLMISGKMKSFHYPIGGGIMREYIAFGSTLSQDGHAGEKFDFCISNPPFGTPWKEDLKNKGLTDKEKDKFDDPRFYAVERNGDEEVRTSFLPDIGDCQMMFLANNLSRMQNDTPIGSRVVEVHNGSSLFTGAAGSGVSNLRKYIIEHDLLEAIVAMPEKDFYNTGIGTYIWVLSNRKEERRKGKVQLIDATAIKTPLRKNLGEKNCETNEDNRAEIMKLFMDFTETSQSKIFPNEEFGYYNVTVERPLRLRVIPNADVDGAENLKVAEKERIKKAMENVSEDVPLNDWNRYAKALKLPKGLLKKLQTIIAERDETAVAVEDTPDPLLRDVEQVPLRYPGGIDAFMQKEVLPYAPDAYYEPEKVIVGYELSFTKYFYKPVELRPIADITTDIESIESRLKGVLADILNV